MTEVKIKIKFKTTEVRVKASSKLITEVKVKVRSKLVPFVQIKVKAS